MFVLVSNYFIELQGLHHIIAFHLHACLKSCQCFIIVLHFHLAKTHLIEELYLGLVFFQIALIYADGIAVITGFFIRFAQIKNDLGILILVDTVQSLLCFLIILQEIVEAPFVIVTHGIPTLVNGILKHFLSYIDVSLFRKSGINLDHLIKILWFQLYCLIKICSCTFVIIQFEGGAALEEPGIRFIRFQCQNGIIDFCCLLVLFIFIKGGSKIVIDIVIHIFYHTIAGIQSFRKRLNCGTILCHCQMHNTFSSGNQTNVFLICSGLFEI